MRKTILLSLLVCLCLGCGTGHYEELLSKRKINPDAEPLSDPQELPGTNVSIRVPRKLGSPMTNAEESRSKPGIVTIPEIKQTYEAFVKDNKDGEQPYYCYIGVVVAVASPMQEIADKLRAELRGQVRSKQVDDWTNFEAVNPNGAKSLWRRLRVTAVQQSFYYKSKGGQGSLVTMPGTLEIYLHEEAGFVVIVAWRLPTGLETFIGLDELTKQMAGSLSVRQ